MQLFALLPCDEVHIDPETGKHFVMGHFGSIKVDKFPATHPQLTLFVGVTDADAGEHTLELLYGTDPDELNPILEQSLESKGPDQRLYMISTLTDITFEKPGTAYMELWADGEVLGTCTITASR